jgi:hypothetical protein
VQLDPVGIQLPTRGELHQDLAAEVCRARLATAVPEGHSKSRQNRRGDVDPPSVAHHTTLAPSGVSAGQ